MILPEKSVTLKGSQRTNYLDSSRNKSPRSERTPIPTPVKPVIKNPLINIGGGGILLKGINVSNYGFSNKKVILLKNVYNK